MLKSIVRKASLKSLIILFKHHFATLIFRIISPLVGSVSPDKYSYEISKPKLVYISNNTYHTNNYSQHTIYKDMHKVTSSVKSFWNYYLSRVCYKIFWMFLHFSIQLSWQFREEKTTTEYIWCRCWTERVRFKCFGVNTCLV